MTSLTRPVRSLTLFVIAAAVLGCNPVAQPSPTASTPTEPPVDLVAIEAAIRKADESWNEAAKTGKAENWVAFYSDDAVVLPPNEPTAKDKASILKSIQGLFALPNVKISWTPDAVSVAKAGDMAYAYGTYQLSFTDSNGKTIEDKGKILEIWKKQSDGSWKCAVDTWNSDLPLGG